MEQDDGRSYSVKIDRSQGIVEITGPDKDWIAEQLARLASVYEVPPTDQSDGPGPAPRAQQESTRTTTAARKKQRRTRTRGGGTARTRVDDDLKGRLTAEVRGKLAAYVNERRVAFDKTKQNKAAIIATFLEDELSMPAIDESALYTIFHVMGWSWTGDPRATINNARVRNGYFGGWTDGKLELTHEGENFGRHASKGAADDS